MELDPVAAGAAVAEVVREQVRKAVAPLLAEIDFLKEKIGIIEGLGCAATAEEVATEVMPAILEEVRRAVAALPPAEPGRDGESVTVEDVHPVLMLELGKWALDFERRAQDVLERAISRIPPPKDGLDGLGFDDLSVQHDGERELTLRFARGDVERTFSFSLPTLIDRGFWREGMAVDKFDGVTFAGSYWIAQKDTDTKPDIGNPDWRLAVKKGRDGKNLG